MSNACAGDWRRGASSVLSQLEQLGLRVFADPQGGMFAWLDAGRDSHVLGCPRLRAAVVAGAGQPVFARSTAVVVAAFQPGFLQPPGSAALSGTGVGR